MICSECDNRKWEEGDHEYSPPGYGVYYCELMSSGGLPEDVAKGRVEPPNCPLVIPVLQEKIECTD